MAINSHENCYKMIGDLRFELNEYSADLVSGTDTSGNYQNFWLLQKLNEAQTYMTAELFRLKPEIFFAQTTIVGVNSVYTLPYNYSKLIEFRDSQGNHIYPASPQMLPSPSGQGSEHLYYRDGNTFVLLKSGWTETYTLYYYKNPRLLTYGQSGASSGALKIHFTGANTVLIDDYYNGLIVDDYTANFTSTITDWVASTQIATVTGTSVNGDWYGTVSELPETFHLLIVPLAELLVSGVHPAAQRKPSADDWRHWTDRFLTAVWTYLSHDEDRSMLDMFADYSSTPPYTGYNIPGQGHTIF